MPQPSPPLPSTYNTQPSIPRVAVAVQTQQAPHPAGSGFLLLQKIQAYSFQLCYPSLCKERQNQFTKKPNLNNTTG